MICHYIINEHFTITKIFKCSLIVTVLTVSIHLAIIFQDMHYLSIKQNIKRITLFQNNNFTNLAVQGYNNSVSILWMMFVVDSSSTYYYSFSAFLFLLCFTNMDQSTRCYTQYSLKKICFDYTFSMVYVVMLPLVILWSYSCFLNITHTAHFTFNEWKLLKYYYNCCNRCLLLGAQNDSLFC